MAPFSDTSHIFQNMATALARRVPPSAASAGGRL